MGPLLQNFPQPQHEHDRTGGGEISPHHRHGDGGGIQHGNGQLPVPQGQKPFFDVLCGADHSQRRCHRRWQKQVGSAAAHNSEGELVLKFPVQGAGGVLRRQIQLLRFFKGEPGQRTDHALPLRVIHHHGIPRPVIDLDGAHAVHRQQIVFQHVRLPQRHSLTAKMDPQPPGCIM